MEINGLANIHMIIDGAEGDISPEVAKKIKEQLVHLERYMLAYDDHKSNVSLGASLDRLKIVHTKDEPMWHEVRDNPEKYPTLREKMNGGSK